MLEGQWRKELANYSDVYVMAMNQDSAKVESSNSYNYEEAMGLHTGPL